MATCICGKTFHACSSCCLDYDWEHHYCSYECWKNGKGYKKWRTKFRTLFKTINSVQRKFLIELLTDMPSDYERELENWVKEIETEEAELLKNMLPSCWPVIGEDGAIPGFDTPHLCEWCRKPINYEEGTFTDSNGKIYHGKCHQLLLVDRDEDQR